MWRSFDFCREDYGFALRSAGISRLACRSVPRTDFIVDKGRRAISYLVVALFGINGQVVRS